MPHFPSFFLKETVKVKDFSVRQEDRDSSFSRLLSRITSQHYHQFSLNSLTLAHQDYFTIIISIWKTLFL